jgi:hypothetical protein
LKEVCTGRPKTLMLLLCQRLAKSDDQKEVHVPQAVLARCVVRTGIKSLEVGVELLLVE